jgi:hypothetical protein
MAALADLEENSIVSGDVEQIVDAEALHGSRSLDLEERRRRVRSQVGFLVLAECCLACGLIVILSLASLHMNCVMLKSSGCRRSRFVPCIFFIFFTTHLSIINITGMGVATFKQWFGWDFISFKTVCWKPQWSPLLM